MFNLYNLTEVFMASFYANPCYLVEEIDHHEFRLFQCICGPFMCFFSLFYNTISTLIKINQLVDTLIKSANFG